MLKQTVRFACLAVLMFAASATPQTANSTSIQFECPCPYPQPPCASYPLPCQLGVEK